MHNIRVRLSVVTPLVSKIVLGFGIFNLLLGAALFAVRARTLDFFIVNDVFTEQFWGLTFVLVGIALMTGYITNHWTTMRVALLLGFALKLFWLLALSARQIEDLNTNVFLLLFFTMVAFVQVVTYVHFPNKEKERVWTRQA